MKAEELIGMKVVRTKPAKITKDTEDSCYIKDPVTIDRVRNDDSIIVSRDDGYAAILDHKYNDNFWAI